MEGEVFFVFWRRGYPSNTNTKIVLMGTIFMFRCPPSPPLEPNTKTRPHRHIFMFGYPLVASPAPEYENVPTVGTILCSGALPPLPWSWTQKCASMGAFSCTSLAAPAAKHVKCAHMHIFCVQWPLMLGCLPHPSVQPPNPSQHPSPPLSCQ